MLYYVLISKGFKKYQIWMGELIRTKTSGAKFFDIFRDAIQPLVFW